MPAPSTELDLRVDLGLQHAVLPLTVPGFLSAVTARFGPRVALRFEGRDLRYDELEQEARDLAGALLCAGVETGDRVAILISNRPEWATAFFGVALVGAIVVPVNTFATPEEREYILRHADARLLLMQRHLAGRDFVAELLARHPELEADSGTAPHLSTLPELRRIVCISSEPLPAAIEPWDDFSTAEPIEARAERVDERAAALVPEDPSLLIYTSGTTDLPKGVLHSQKAAVIQSWRFAEILDLHEDDIVLTAQPFFWTAGISMSLGATLAAGAKLLLQETFDAEAALDCAERERATTVHAWVHQEKAMAEHPSAQGRDFGPLHRVEFDSPLAPLAGLERDVWGIHASYGMTETFTLVSALPTWASAEDRTGNSGVALPGMEIRIVHPETGEACRAGQRGEIIVRGVTLMQGYWKVPAQDVFDGDGFFHTSDGGYLDSEGRLHWEGRLSGIIKTGGANVSPLEVEKAAADQPAVRAAIAVGVPHPTLGEAIVLCVVPTAGHRVDEASLSATLKRRLAAYKVPKHLVVVSESEAPTTGTQKLRADALRELAQERLVAGRVEIAGHVYGG